MNPIEFCNLKAQYKAYQSEIDEAMQNVLNHGRFIMGPEISEVEKNLSEFTGSRYAITCSNGSDALLLAFMALDLKAGDEIITTPFSFFSTASMISYLGLKPVFADIKDDDFNINPQEITKKITSKTKAILPVSLYGQPADMDEIVEIAKAHNLHVIEDAAQSFGAEYKNKKSCHLSELATTSFFPAKPLGCYGDGGALFTDDENLAKRLKTLRVHGQTKRYQHEFLGMNGRFDTLQAAILNIKLKHFPNEIVKRQSIAKKYDKNLKDFVKTPKIQNNRKSVYAQYTIRVQNRDQVREKLKEKGVPTAVHYPVPLHLQKSFEELSYQKNDFPVAEKISQEVLSLPMSAFVTDSEIDYIVTTLKKTLQS